jgi:DNA polymerase-3 subunit alpha
VRVAGLITVVRPYVTKAGKPMGFVTIEDVQGNIELVLFPRTWDRTRTQLTVGQIIVVDGKADTGNTPPKILVDSIWTDIQAASSAIRAAGKKAGGGGASPRPAQQPQPVRRTSAVADHTSKGPMSAGQASRPDATPVAAMQASGAAPTPRVSQKADGAQGEQTDDFGPPPPDNFPLGWETEWQPSFENAVAAEQAEVAVDNPSPQISPQAPPDDGPPGGPTPVSTPAPNAPTPSAFPQVSAAAASEQARDRGPLPSLYVPLAREEREAERPPRQITVMLRSTGDKEHDKRRIKTIYGTLISFHGRDRFSFHIFENGRAVLMDFPGETTQVCPEMLGRLKKLLGEESWRVEEIKFQ